MCVIDFNCQLQSCSTALLQILKTSANRQQVQPWAPKRHRARLFLARRLLRGRPRRSVVRDSWENYLHDLEFKNLRACFFTWWSLGCSWKVDFLGWPGKMRNTERDRVIHKNTNVWGEKNTWYFWRPNQWWTMYFFSDQGDPTTNFRQSEFTTEQNKYNVMQ